MRRRNPAGDVSILSDAALLGAFAPTSGAASGNLFYCRARPNRDVALIDDDVSRSGNGGWGPILGASDASALPKIPLKHR